MPALWNELDSRAVSTAKILAADAVERVGNGHPGAAISLAPAAYALYHRHMHLDPHDPQWLGRDRFILSSGHSSLTQYLQLYLAGMGVELEDLQALRTEGALTPGHPEYGHTPGVELTTGPLGTGIASAVGFAMAERFTHGLLDPATPYGESVFDHKVYVIAGDGCLQEGVSAEASSLAGTQKLGNLIVLWDDNRISIEGDTDIAFSEDVLARYAAYGWHVQRVNWLSEDGSYTEDVTALDTALEAARANTEQPSIIALRTWEPTLFEDLKKPWVLTPMQASMLTKKLSLMHAVNLPLARSSCAKSGTSVSLSGKNRTQKRLRYLPVFVRVKCQAIGNLHSQPSLKARHWQPDRPRERC